MLLEQTLDKLNQMKLFGMANSLKDRLSRSDHAELPVADILGLIVDDEWLYRDNKRLTSRLSSAKFKNKAACIEDIQYKGSRGIKKSQILDLAQNRWITGHQNILFTGPSGSGKSFMAQALGQNACRAGFLVQYLRMPKLLVALLQARADGSYSNLLKRLAKNQLLILDDFGVSVLDDQQREDLLEIIEDRYGAGSTVITSQLPVASWHAYLGGGIVADAILDRLVHNAHRFELKTTESIRKEQAESQPDLHHRGQTDT
jgi:DNA replication protein DnaC